MLAAAGGAVWLAQLGPHTGYAAGVLGPLILAGVGLGMVIAPVINTGTFGVAPQDAGEASATVTVGQQLGASVGTSLLNTIFAGAVTSYLAAHLATARLIGRQALTGLALAHGYDTTFWWTAGDLRRRRSPRRHHAPPRPTDPQGHPVTGTRRGDNSTSPGGPRPSRVAHRPRRSYGPARRSLDPGDEGSPADLNHQFSPASCAETNVMKGGAR